MKTTLKNLVSIFLTLLVVAGIFGCISIGQKVFETDIRITEMGFVSEYPEGGEPQFVDPVFTSFTTIGVYVEYVNAEPVDGKVSLEVYTALMHGNGDAIVDGVVLDYTGLEEDGYGIIILELDNMENGEYIVLVVITDRNAGTEFRREIMFEIENGIEL